MARKSSVTWLASSRVGARINAVGLPPLGVSRSTIGMANASVLPEPVPRAREHVASRDRVAEHELLDREGTGDAAHLERVDDRLRDAELGEAGKWDGGCRRLQGRQLRHGGGTPWVHGSL